MTHPEGEGPSDRGKSKERAAKVLHDPKHHAEKGSQRDLETIDGEIPDRKPDKEDTDD